MVTSIEQTPAMTLIRARRKRLRLSYERAAVLAGITGTRWRQIEDGFRTTKIGRIPETGPASTIARMAYVVGVSADELRECGEPVAADELALYATDQANGDTLINDEARRLAATVGGLNERQRDALIEDLRYSLRRVRDLEK